MKIENLEKWNEFVIENKIEIDKWREYLGGNTWPPILWVDKTKKYKLMMSLEEWKNRDNK